MSTLASFSDIVESLSDVAAGMAVDSDVVATVDELIPQSLS